MASSEHKHHGAVVVALPAKEDPVHSIGEEPKHATVAYLGDDISDDDLAKVQAAVADYATGDVGPFPERVKGVESLGDDGARVWMLHSDDGLADIHDDMAKHPVIGPLMAKADQFPTYAPHVTIGYPAGGGEGSGTAAPAHDVTTDRGELGSQVEQDAGKVDHIRFDRLGVWRGPDQTEHPLRAGVAEISLFPIAEMAKLLELAGQETPGSHGDEARLKRWWRDNFDWGTPGDFAACVVRATEVFGKHGVDIDPKAWCARMHKDATGAWPGHAPGETHESQEVPMSDDLTLVETVTIDEAAAKAASKTGRFLMQFISPGWGSSGYYSPKVLQEAARGRIIPAGTHMYADHPTAAEAKARPERSIKDLMAVTTEDARLAQDGALVGEVEVVPSWRPFVETVAPHIGVSIRGDATDIKPGVAEGRKGPIIEGLAHVHSVDFVTRAGRGGRVLELLESAIEGADVTEEQITQAIAEDATAPTHVPAARPGDKKEARMGMKEIEESEFDRLTEAAGRVTTLESQLSTAQTALSEAQGQLTEARAALVPNKDLRDRISGLVTENATLRAREVAAPMIAEALEDAFIGEVAKKRLAGELIEGIVLKEDAEGGRPTLDTEALTEAINTAVRVAEAEAQELREAMGGATVGQPRGLGRPSGGLLVEQKVGEYTDTTAGAIGKAFGLSEESAKTAAAGR